MAWWTPGPLTASTATDPRRRIVVDGRIVWTIFRRRGGSPGTPPHDDEPPPPPLAPEDARKLELAAAIFGESGLEVDLDARTREAATAARVLTDSEFDESEEDSDYEPGEESDSESDVIRLSPT